MPIPTANYTAVVHSLGKVPQGKQCATLNEGKQWCRLNSEYEDDVWTIMDSDGRVVTSGVIEGMYEDDQENETGMYADEE